jgi:hypothetical protein
MKAILLTERCRVSIVRSCCHNCGVLVLFFVLLLGRSLAWGQDESSALSGTVVDAANGETLPGANVWLKPGLRGAATNLHGRFLIEKLSPGKYELVVCFIGCAIYQD